MNDNARMAEWLGTANRQDDESIKHNMWAIMHNLGIATTSELELVTKLNGYTIEVLESVLFARTGYRTIEQMWEEYKNY